MMKYKRREAVGDMGGYPPNFLYFTFIIETLGGSLPCLPLYKYILCVCVCARAHACVCVYIYHRSKALPDFTMLVAVLAC